MVSDRDTYVTGPVRRAVLLDLVIGLSKSCKFLSKHESPSPLLINHHLYFILFMFRMEKNE